MVSTLSETVFSWVHNVFGVYEDEALIHRMTLIAMIYTIVVGIASIVQPIAYGKLSDGNAFTMNARVAWSIQEAPAFIVPLLLIIQTPCSALIESTGNKVALFCFMAHYFHRAFIYPFRFINPKPAPIINFVMAFIFCYFNGLLQGLHLTNVYTIETNTSTILGTLILLIGMAINIHSDGTLINLRKTSGKVPKGKSEYKVPRGGLFEYISCANYFGEIIEWWGLYIVTCGMPQLTFAVFSNIFLGLRAVHGHQWYKKTFGSSYPSKRRAIIPFVF
ncbi:hypothetical protein HA402_006171 [Bradysia odoriphaga]|nr:hypothetical protein HA402_006171 [Bradysia odoriphaga]